MSKEDYREVLERYAPLPWRRREGTSVIEDANGRDVLVIVARVSNGELEGARARAIVEAILSNSTRKELRP